MRASDDLSPLVSTPQDREPAACRLPLATWRSEQLPAIGASAISAVRRALAGRVCLHHRCWPAARRGDAAAAIAVALDLTRVPAVHPAVVDLALSAVLVAAWRGDAAAETVLAHVLDTASAAGPPDTSPLAGSSRPGCRHPPS